LGLCVVLTALVVLVSMVAVPLAGASRSSLVPATPLSIQSASFVQSGRDLVWSVTLDSPFSPAHLARGDRSLCLLLGSPPSGVLCVTGPRRGGRLPRLTYRPAKSPPAQATPIAAAVTRAGSRELTASFLPSEIGLRYRQLHWQVQSTTAPPACHPVNASGSPCVIVFPAAPARTPLHTPRLVGCTATGSDLAYSGTTAGREIALTFDDGPWYQTPQFVSLLARYGVVGTFFQIGRQMTQYGEDGALDRRMLADGDMIGDHTWSHPDVAGAGVFARDQIEDAADAIRQATGGFEPCLFRAPYGELSPALLTEARSMGFTTIQWNIDPRDWSLPGVGEIEGNVLDNARPGAIVEMHDGGGDRSETLAALPDIIDTLRARGYRFVTVTQLLGQQLIYR
jgi:peptidoglycan/xylan/chitin deacetylase (PgdA/CDA1 family)